MHNDGMDQNELRSLAIHVAQRARIAGLTQEYIAKAVSASQSQVSRVLSGRAVRRTRLFDEICIYVDNAAKGISPELVRENDELIDAIASVWDGTAHHARALAEVIRSLGALRASGAGEHVAKTHKRTKQC
jgi:transcriptional regulator with XRE-family HTH domain